MTTGRASNNKSSAAKTNKAPSNVPKNQGWSTVGVVLLMLIWVGASVIASQFIVGMAMVAMLGAEELSRPVPMAIYTALSYLLALVLIVFVPIRAKKLWLKRHRVNSKGDNEPSIDREDLGLKGWPTWTDIGLAPVGFIFYMFLAAGLAAIFSCFPWFQADEAQQLGFSIYSTGLDRAIAFLILVVVAPVAEEIIFRGWLYGKLRETFHGIMPKTTGMLLAIFLTSLLFGIVHLQWNVGVNVFALSVVLCGLREVTGTIYAGILLHMLKNGVAFYLLYVLGLS